MTAADTRLQIVATADRLFYQQGFEATSFAHIADAIGLSRGNFYYHFKTKDEILRAVIDKRLADTRTLLEGWESEAASPAERIRCFIGILVTNRASIMAHGCPVGSLCNELAKLDHLAREDAARLFVLFRDWLVAQFHALGKGVEAERLALHLIMRSQGVAVMAAALRDEAFLRREVDDMTAWLEAQLEA